jgi:alkyldihydroxyacetonephosphate synthase
MSAEPVAAVPVAAEPGAVTEHFGGPRVPVPTDLLEAMARTGAEIRTDDATRTETGRDWWPLAIAWAVRGEVPARAGAVVRPATTDQVSGVLALCAAARVPVTPMGGRSGVCGGSVPVFGGVALDLTALTGPVMVDETSLIADVPAGIFGPDLESELRARGEGYTLGHWPQSMDLSTVGGWLACRGAGQLSTRYGKIEDMVVGLEVVLADGLVVHTEGRGPRAATGPNLTQLFVGSEGTLGVITKARLRIHPAPETTGRRAFGFETFVHGLEACRRVLRRGATPAVLRLYDGAESQRNFGLGDTCALVVLDEGDATIVRATLDVVDDECDPVRGGRTGAAAKAAAATTRLDDAIVDHWLAHRNDVSALVPLWRADIVVDTIEIAGRWAVLGRLADHVRDELYRLAGTIVASVHQSHAYPDGACLYFTFAGQAPGAGGAGEPDGLAWQERYYRQAWDVVIAAVESHGASISHHHGIGLNRARFMPGSLGGGLEVMHALKGALDPAGILNPAKLGLRSEFGDAPWP